MIFSNSLRTTRRLHELIPGGCHTYAKGDDQFPECSPGAIVRGQGSHVWDVDGNEFIEYGMGLRAVTLGHAYPPVAEAAREQILRGANFSRPAAIELECAEALLSFLPEAEMVKFAKDGSSVTTAAVKLARAVTGRPRVALCADHPFFAVHDWFMGTTPIHAGIPTAVRELSLTFRYNDLESLEALFQKYPGEIAAVILEPVKYDEPEDHFLHRVQECCERHGALFILDEMITGFRLHAGGVQSVYGVTPDLSCFGKGMANGFSLSALVGKRKYMERGGLYHDHPRVFLLSTTHGAETHAMAAAIATLDVYRQEPVIATLAERGTRLAAALRQEIAVRQLESFVQVIGHPSNLVFVARDPDGQPSQAYRTLLMQELIARQVLAPSLVLCYSHTEQDLADTVQAFRGALDTYQLALREGVEHYLVGKETQVVYREYNAPQFRVPPWA